MKKLRKAETVYLEEYGVSVNKYLTSSQIQTIVNAIMQFDKWMEREQNKILLTLLFATDINQAELESLDYNIVEESGLAAKVIACIANFDKIDEAVKYEESMDKFVKLAIEEVKNGDQKR